MNRRTLLLLGCGLLAATATSCSEPAPEPTTPPSATPNPEQPEWTYSTPSPTDDGPDDVPDDSLIDEPADEDARAGAAAAATATAQVWIQGSTLEQQDWNEQLMATLTPIAQDSYRDRWWGYRVEETEITGDAEISAATMVSATVAVPTNTGDLVLTVTRPAPTDSWLTSGIQTPTTQQ